MLVTSILTSQSRDSHHPFPQQAKEVVGLSRRGHAGSTPCPKAALAQCTITTQTRRSQFEQLPDSQLRLKNHFLAKIRSKDSTNTCSESLRGVNILGSQWTS